MISFFCRMFRLLSFLCFVLISIVQLGTATYGHFWQFVSLYINNDEGSVAANCCSLLQRGGVLLLTVFHACEKRVKGKVHLRTVHEVPEMDQMYRSSLSLTSAVGGDGQSTPHAGCFASQKETRRQSRPALSAESLAPSGIRFTDSPAHSVLLYRLSYPGPHKKFFLGGGVNLKAKRLFRGCLRRCG